MSSFSSPPPSSSKPRITTLSSSGNPPTSATASSPSSSPSPPPPLPHFSRNIFHHIFPSFQYTSRHHSVEIWDKKEGHQEVDNGMDMETTEEEDTDIREENSIHKTRDKRGRSGYRYRSFFNPRTIQDDRQFTKHTIHSSLIPVILYSHLQDTYSKYSQLQMSHFHTVALMKRAPQEISLDNMVRDVDEQLRRNFVTSEGIMHTYKPLSATSSPSLLEDDAGCGLWKFGRRLVSFSAIRAQGKDRKLRKQNHQRFLRDLTKRCEDPATRSVLYRSENNSGTSQSNGEISPFSSFYAHVYHVGMRIQAWTWLSRYSMFIFSSNDDLYLLDWYACINEPHKQVLQQKIATLLPSSVPHSIDDEMGLDRWVIFQSKNMHNYTFFSIWRILRDEEYVSKQCDPKRNWQDICSPLEYIGLLQLPSTMTFTTRDQKRRKFRVPHAKPILMDRYICYTSGAYFVLIDILELINEHIGPFCSQNPRSPEGSPVPFVFDIDQYHSNGGSVYQVSRPSPESVIVDDEELIARNLFIILDMDGRKLEMELSNGHKSTTISIKLESRSRIVKLQSFVRIYYPYFLVIGSHAVDVFMIEDEEDLRVKFLYELSTGVEDEMGKLRVLRTRVAALERNFCLSKLIYISTTRSLNYSESLIHVAFSHALYETPVIRVRVLNDLYLFDMSGREVGHTIVPDYFYGHPNHIDSHYCMLGGNMISKYSNKTREFFEDIDHAWEEDETGSGE